MFGLLGDRHAFGFIIGLRAKRVEFVFAAQRDGAEQLNELGYSARWLPLACDPAIHRPHDLPKRWDVCFIGMMAPGPRQELIELLHREFSNSFFGQCYFEEYARTNSQARVGFNRSLLNDVNMRVFETLGCGTLLVTNDLADNGQEELVTSGKHLVTYRSPDELLDKVRYYLQHDEVRERIARAGHVAALEQHTYLHRMQSLLATVLGQHGKNRLVAWAPKGNPTHTDETVARADDWLGEIDFAVKTFHRPQALLRLMRSIERYYPAAHVTISDDGDLRSSPDADSRACCEWIDAHPQWTLRSLPRESGVVVGRNALIDQTRRPFLLFLDDDFCFTDETRIERLFQRLEQSATVGVVAGCCRDVVGSEQRMRNSGGTLSIQGDTLHIDTQGWCDREQATRDYVPQFCLVRRSVLETVRWRGGIGGEHYDFCLQLQQSGWQVVQDLAVCIDHYPATPALPGYRERRLDVAEAQQQLLKTWHLRRIVQDGQVIIEHRCAANERAHAALETDVPPDPWYFDLARPEVAALVPAAARRVLDLGCGTGALGARLKSRGPVEVVGVELHAPAAAVARQRLDQVHEVNAESAELSFPEGRFDCVICADILEHLRNPGQVLTKIRRWLTPDGCLVASVPNVRHHSVIASLLDGNWTYESAGLLDQDHVRFFTRREIEKLLYRCGFTVESLQSIPGPGDDPWGSDKEPGAVQIGRLQLQGLSPGTAQEFFTYQFLVVARTEPRRARTEPELTSIVLVTLNECAYTRACLDSVRLRTDEPYELIVVDNGSTDDTLEYLRSLPDVTVIANRDNTGFPAAANQGIRAARGRNILLLNNDTLVTTGWLRRMLDVFDREPEVGLIGPVTNNCSGLQVVVANYDRLEALDGFAWEWAAAYHGQTVETDRLVGYCLMFRRAVIERIGLLDERFGIGNYEDDDFCRRAIGAGFKAVIAADTYIHHFGSRTFRASGINFAALMEENRRKYESKWGPASESASASATPTSSSPDSHTEKPRTLVPAPPGAPCRPAFLIRSSPEAGLLLARNNVRLSGCLIVRNNETTIGPCLESIRPHVDELVVVDTGSTDRTPAICREHGARLFHFPWCDDFSAARNVSLAHARGDWLFWMDSDDTIPESCGRKLQEVVAGVHDPSVLGYVMQVHCPGPNDGSGENVTVVDHVKLIRNRPDLRFEGRIHEQLLPAIRRAGGEVAWTDLYVVHSGADHSPAGWQRKLARDLRILHQELRDQPDHPFVLFNLGMTYADAKNYDEAIGYLEQCVAVSRPEESHLRKAYALLVSSLSQAERHAAARSICQRGLALYADDKELLFRSALLHHHFGDLVEAEQAYWKVLNAPEERHFSSIDQGLTGYKARHNLALVYDDLGCLDQAEEQWREVTRLAPEYLSGWRGLGDTFVRRQDFSAAARLCEQLLAKGGSLHREGLLLRGRLAAATGDIAAAVRDWHAADTLDPEDLEPLQSLCRLHFDSGALDAAEESLRQLTARSPGDAAALHNLGTVQTRRNTLDAAVQSYRRSVALRPNSVATWLQLGWALREGGKPHEALSAWREVLRCVPGHAEAMAELAAADAKE